MLGSVYTLMSIPVYRNLLAGTYMYMCTNNVEVTTKPEIRDIFLTKMKIISLDKDFLFRDRSFLGQSFRITKTE